MPSIKELFIKKKINKEMGNEDILHGGNDEPEESGQEESQEEFRGEEAQETTDETEAQNELDSQQGDELKASMEEDSEIDDENDLESVKNDDHISDNGAEKHDTQEGLNAITKRKLLERIRKLKGA